MSIRCVSVLSSSLSLHLIELFVCFLVAVVEVVVEAHSEEVVDVEEALDEEVVVEEEASVEVALEEEAEEDSSKSRLEREYVLYGWSYSEELQVCD